MTAVLNIVIPGLAILAIAVTFYYGLRAFRHKSAIAQEPYNVGQQDVRRAMQVDMLRAGLFLVVALILLGVIGFMPQPTEPFVEEVLEATNTATAVPPTATVNIPPATTVPDTAVPTQPSATEPPPAQPTEPIIVPTQVEPTAAPTITPIPAPQTAVVTSEVGVWLRDTPGLSSEQIEWLLNNTELIILTGTATADDFEWQQVRAPSGNEGWVASPYIAYSE